MTMPFRKCPPGLATREARAGNGPAPSGKKRSSRLMEPEGKLLKGLLQPCIVAFCGGEQKPVHEHSSLTLVLEIGHRVQQEIPEETNNAVLRFVAGIK